MLRHLLEHGRLRAPARAALCDARRGGFRAPARLRGGAGCAARAARRLIGHVASPRLSARAAGCAALVAGSGSCWHFCLLVRLTSGEQARAAETLLHERNELNTTLFPRTHRRIP